MKIWERIVRYGPLICWIAVVFFLSSGSGSMSETSLFIRPLLEFLLPGTAPETIVVYHGYIRKLAHFVVYATLAPIAVRAFRTSSIGILKRRWFICAFCVVVIVAGLDEYNQSFEASRTSSIFDVFIDMCGGYVTLVVCFVAERMRRKTK